MWKPTNTYSYNPNELYHHGILGMSWGHRNGPPYPLDASDHSAKEKKAGWKKSLGGGSTSSKKKKDNNSPIVYKKNPISQRLEENRYQKSLIKTIHDPKSNGKEFSDVTREHDVNYILENIDTLMDKYNRTGTKTAIGMHKREKLKKEWESEIKKLDEPFKNPKVQKQLINKVRGELDSTEPTSKSGFGAYEYLSKRLKDSFGDWYWGEYKSDNAKAAYKQYLKDMEKYGTYANKQKRKGQKIDPKLRIEAHNKLAKAAMKEAGFDSSIYNDDEMVKKFNDIIFWD